MLKNFLFNRKNSNYFKCAILGIVLHSTIFAETDRLDYFLSCSECTSNPLYTEERPWGSFTVLEEGQNYKVKRITVLPNKRLSLQTHNHRSEHWVIVKGSGLATIGEDLREVSTNDQIYIAVKQLHRIHNTGEEPLIFIETQCGDYLGEDDIIRYSDDYNRETKNETKLDSLCN